MSVAVAGAGCGRPTESTSMPSASSASPTNRLIHEQREALTNGETLAEAAILESPLNVQLAGAIQEP